MGQGGAESKERGRGYVGGAVERYDAGDQRGDGEAADEGAGAGTDSWWAGWLNRDCGRYRQGEGVTRSSRHANVCSASLLRGWEFEAELLELR